MPEAFEVRVNGEVLLVDERTTVAVAIAKAGISGFRRSVRGEWRAPLCGMGICAECRASVNGVANRNTCQIWCKPGMLIETEET